MALPSLPLTGACLCGAVQIRATKPPLLTLACHCRDCQKLTASAFSMTTMFPADGFTCSGALIKGGLKSPGRDHYFCAACLNFVYSTIGVGSKRVNLRTSMLDAAPDLPPFAEIMAKDKLPWVTLPVPHSFETAPQSLDALGALMDAYADAQ